MGFPKDNELDTLLDAMAGVLIRCFFFTVIAMLFTWAVILTMGDPIYTAYTWLIDLTRPEFDRFILESMSLMKILNIVFFFIPYLAITHYLRSHRKQATQ